jgi:hypothetical protein
VASGLKRRPTTLPSAHAPLSGIDWCAPWLSPWRSLGEPIGQRIIGGASQHHVLDDVAQARCSATGQAVMCFVPQSELPAGDAYESHIFHHHCCPTRDGLHDFFNGLAWLHFPLIKQRLNQLHVAQIARTGIAPVRGPARDALTLFDENAALLRAPDALWNALQAKDWARVFGDLRGLWAQSSLVLFGHALLEKLVSPRKSITAHVYRTYPVTDSIADMDAWVAGSLNAEVLAGKPFVHLPVLGVPGWCAANADVGYYDDPFVFRKLRTAD